VAAVKGHVAVVRRLLAAGAEPQVTDAYGWTPLMRAVEARRHDVVRVLLDAPGTDLATRQESGATALHIAAATGDLAMVRLLVNHGADRAVTDNGGRTPAAVARSVGHPDVAEFLRSPG
jgi:ankyrin repeat protein